MSQPLSAPADPTLSLIARDLSFHYGKSPTLVGIKWEVARGSLAGVYGPSGAGKSTLLALFAGAIARASGTLSVCGRDPAESAGRQNIGYMPQAGGLYPGYTIEENLRVFAVGAGPPGSLGSALTRMLEPFVIGVERQALIDEAVTRTLGFIGLTNRRHEAIGNLPLGLQQRVSLGIALMWNPELLLLDDPLSHADDAWAATVWNHLEGHTKRGHTVIFATARARDALKCEHLALLRTGRLLRAGRTTELVPPGKARVSLRYASKTGPLTEDYEVENLAAELPRLLEKRPAVKPTAIDVRPDDPALRLAALLEL